MRREIAQRLPDRGVRHRPGAQHALRLGSDGDLEGANTPTVTGSWPGSRRTAWPPTSTGPYGGGRAMAAVRTGGAVAPVTGGRRPRVRRPTGRRPVVGGRRPPPP